MISQLIIKSLKMKVNFKAKVHLQLNGQPITQSIPNHHPTFQFNQPTQLILQKNKKKINIQAIITTDKGSRYIGGMAFITQSHFLSNNVTHLSLPLEKSYDRHAQLLIQFKTMNNGQNPNLQMMDEVEEEVFQIPNSEHNRQERTNLYRSRQNQTESKDQLILQLENELSELQNQFDRKLEEEKDKLENQFQMKIHHIENSFSAKLMNEKTQYLEIIQQYNEELEERNQAIYSLQLQLNQQRMFKASQSLTQGQWLRNKVQNLEKANKLHGLFEVQAKQRIKIAQRNYQKVKEQLKSQQQQCIKSTQEATELRQKNRVMEQANNQLLKKLKQQNKQITIMKNQYHKYQFQLELKENDLMSAHHPCKQKEKQLQKIICAHINTIQELKIENRQAKFNLQTTLQHHKQLQGQKFSLIKQLQQVKQSLSSIKEEYSLLSAELTQQKTQKQKLQWKNNELAHRVQFLQEMNKKYKNQTQSILQQQQRLLLAVEDNKQLRQLTINQQSSLQHKDKELQWLKQSIKQSEEKLAKLKKKTHSQIVQISNELSYDLDEEQPLLLLKELMSRDKAIFYQVKGQLQHQLKQLKQQLQYKNNHIYDLVKNIDTHQTTAQSHGRQLKEVHLILLNKQQQIHQLTNEHTNLISIHQQYISQFNHHKLTTQQQIDNLILTQKQQLQQLSASLTNTHQQQKQTLNTNIHELNQQLQQQSSQQQLIQLQLRRKTSSLQQLQQQLNTQQQEISTLQHQSAQLQSTIVNLSTQLQEVKIQVKREKDYSCQLKLRNQQFTSQLCRNRQVLSNNNKELIKIPTLQATISSLRKQNENTKQLLTQAQSTKTKKQQQIAQLSIEFNQQQNKNTQTIEMYQKLTQNLRNKTQVLQSRIEEVENQSAMLMHANQREKSKVDGELVDVNFKVKSLEQTVQKLKKQLKVREQEKLLLNSQNQTIKSSIEEYLTHNQQLEKDVHYLHSENEKLTEEIKDKEENLFIVSGRYHELQKKYKQQLQKHKHIKRQLQERLYRRMYSPGRQIRTSSTSKKVISSAGSEEG